MQGDAANAFDEFLRRPLFEEWSAFFKSRTSTVAPRRYYVVWPSFYLVRL
jgi:hypothetical protein